MNEVLRELEFCFPYLDDIFIYSRSFEEHEGHLWILFGGLHTYGVIINPTKCVFRAPKVTFLDYKVSAEGSRSLVERVTHLLDYSLPKQLANSVVSWAYQIFIGDFCPTPLLLRHHSMASSPAPGSRVDIASTGRRNSKKLSMRARRVCRMPH
jgi:hypothetical protein